MKTEEEIRKELSLIIEEQPNNYSKILSLSNELAKFDEDNVRFSVDAGVIDRLGSELVARQETAVSELVKNSYDADAKKVRLTFNNSSNIGGTLIIYDDGVGMTKEQLINGFMRISSADKLRNPYSDIYKRKRAGRKGIGRFAVQRLGEKLTIITQTKNIDEVTHITIEWDKYTSDTDLFYITNEIKTSPKKQEQEQEQGTTLIIEGLKDKWTEAAIKRIYRYVADILQPFPLSEELENSESENVKISVDPGFKTNFYIGLPDGTRKKIVDEKIMIYNHAVATIEGEIDNNGYANYSIKSPKLSYELPKTSIGVDIENPELPFTFLRNVRFRAYYFIYDADLIPKMHTSAIRRLASISGGIRLYRNGFRVLPYGEQGNDWLSLDSSARRRSILPVHSNMNFFGFVEVGDDSGEFEETSSREGLMENESLIQLKNYIYRSIVSAVINVAEIRNIKIVSGQKKDTLGNWEKLELSVKNIAYTLDELDKALENEEAGIVAKAKRKKKLQSLKKEIGEVQKLQKEEAKKLLKDQSILRVLSSVGLTVGQFVHEIKYYLQNISSDINFIQNNYEKDEFSELVSQRLNILRNNFHTFKSYLSYFDNVISQNVVRELSPIELRDIVRPFIDSMNKDAEGANIHFAEPIFNGYYLYTKPMHKSEWSSIMFNLYTNARKAIKKTYNSEINSGGIQIECGVEENNIYMEFSDTGIGIPEEYENKIFEAFFTTTHQASLNSMDENTEILGTGLGLKIVSDIVKSYKGTIRIVSPKESYSTCIRVEIPKATDKELNEYGL